jgi:hypothetical protein
MKATCLDPRLNVNATTGVLLPPLATVFTANVVPISGPE